MKNSPQYAIHPAIGIARLGNSPTDFYLAPESAGGLPVQCGPDGNAILDKDGKESLVTKFKDSKGLVKRQAARFRIYVYDKDHPEGRELKIGDPIQGVGSQGKLIDIEWTVYLANKKAVWYEFSELRGEHGYNGEHPLRNAGITDPNIRQQLIIDPGPQTIYGGFYNKTTSASFTKGENPAYSQCFPPDLQPSGIQSLGNMMTCITPDNNIRLTVCGGFGNSGSFLQGFGQPTVEDYANNDGWFDDTSDGYVSAKLIYYDETDNQQRFQQVSDPSWLLVGYPRYAPQIIDMITVDDLLYDLFVRQFGYNPYLYGPGLYVSAEPIDSQDPSQLHRWRAFPKKYNPDFYPLFYRDIWPILTRPYNMQWCTDLLNVSNVAHETVDPRGDFYQTAMATPPKANGEDTYKDKRLYVFAMLRQPGEENLLKNYRSPDSTPMYGKELMPLLCGDNPLSNELPSKFLRLTDTQLFLLKQWAAGKFLNEKMEGMADTVQGPTLVTGTDIDRGVLANALGGAFCPGAEAAWILRNPAIYSRPWRIKASPTFLPDMTNATAGDTPGNTAILDLPALSQTGDLSTGLEPGDLTKYSALPWQADFNECSINPTNVTYELWNNLYPGSTGDAQLAASEKTFQVLWWPAHRPMQIYVPYPQPPDPVTQKVNVSYQQEDWARGIPQTPAGDLKMVTEWSHLGFVVFNPDYPANNGLPKYIETEYTGQIP